MPRAEIPEGVERWTIVHGRDDAEDGAILVCDLPKLYAHWLEQLKEELLSDEVIRVLDAALAPVFDQDDMPAIPDYRRAVEELLASIPVEEGAGR